jgi:hypothetical protein
MNLGGFWTGRVTLGLFCALIITAGILVAINAGRASSQVPAAVARSAATCRPNPCRAGSYVGYKIRVSDGAGKLVTRTFGVYRPAGLTNSPSNKVPLVVAINNSDWFPLAVRAHFVVLVILNDAHCGSNKLGNTNCQFQAKWVNPDPRTVGTVDCGAGGNQPCDDAPRVAAALKAVECSGRLPCQNIDTSRVFASGSSKGGTLVQDLMCDPAMTHRFAGYQVISIPMISPSTRNNSRALPRCAAVLSRHPNVHFSAQWIFGDKDPIYDRFCAAHADCLEGGWTDAKNRWVFGLAQTAGDSAFGTRVFGKALGCTGTPAVSMIGASAIDKVYGSCTDPGVATSYVKVLGGGHGEPGTNGVGGFDPNATSWNFWLTHLPASSLASGHSRSRSS